MVVFVVAGSNTLPSFEPIWMSPLQHCSPGWSCPSHAKSTPTRCLPCDLRDPKFLTPCDTPKPAKLRPALSEMTDVCSHLYPGCRTKLNGLAAGDAAPAWSSMEEEASSRVLVTFNLRCSPSKKRLHTSKATREDKPPTQFDALTSSWELQDLEAQHRWNRALQLSPKACSRNPFKGLGYV